MKKINMLLMMLAIIVFTLTAYASDDGELCVVLGPEPESLDPAITLTIDVRSYLSHLFEGLTVLDEHGNVLPGCAKEWYSNDDFTQFTFIMDETAIWSDGKQVTAENFRYEWLRVLNPETASGWASFLYYIQGAEAFNSGEGNENDVGIFVDENGNLIVVLDAPCAFFPSMTAMQPYYPVREDIVNGNENWTYSPKTCITNGAYTVSEWNHDQSLVLKRSVSFHKASEGKFDSIRFLLMENSDAIMNAFEAGEVDFVGRTLTVDEMEQVGEVHFCDYTITKFLSLNARRDIFSDVRVREAISICLDRSVISAIMGSGYRPLCSWLPYGFINVETGLDFRIEAEHETYYEPKADLEKARALLQEAGYPGGKGLPELDYLTNTSSLNVRLAEVVKEQLAKVGINVNVVTYEQKTFGEHRRNRDFDIVAASWAAEYPDISSYFYGFQSKDINNYAGFTDDRYDKLYLKALSLTEPTQRYKLYHEMEDMLMASWYVIPLYCENSSYICSDDLTGYLYDITDCLNFNNAK